MVSYQPKSDFWNGLQQEGSKSTTPMVVKIIRDYIKSLNGKKMD